MAMRPPVVSSSPAIILSSVDLPQPEGPTNTAKSPCSMSIETPWMTLAVPKDFSTLLSLTPGIDPASSRKRSVWRLLSAYATRSRTT